jgi:hypothetical protein
MTMNGRRGTTDREEIANKQLNSDADDDNNDGDDDGIGVKSKEIIETILIDLDRTRRTGRVAQTSIQATPQINMLID